QVGVLNDAEVSARLIHRGANRRPLALIALMAQHADAIRMAAGELLGDLRRSVGRAVIDHDDLAVHSVRKRSVENALQQRSDELLLVIEGNQNRRSEEHTSELQSR